VRASRVQQCSSRFELACRRGSGARGIRGFAVHRAPNAVLRLAPRTHVIQPENTLRCAHLREEIRNRLAAFYVCEWLFSAARDPRIDADRREARSDGARRRIIARVELEVIAARWIGYRSAREKCAANPSAAAAGPRRNQRLAGLLHVKPDGDGLRFTRASAIEILRVRQDMRSCSCLKHCARDRYARRANCELAVLGRMRITPAQSRECREKFARTTIAPERGTRDFVFSVGRKDFDARGPFADRSHCVADFGVPDRQLPRATAPLLRASKDCDGSVRLSQRYMGPLRTRKRVGKKALIIAACRLWHRIKREPTRRLAQAIPSLRGRAASVHRFKRCPERRGKAARCFDISERWRYPVYARARWRISTRNVSRR
jgi:hypothetical protein